MECPRGELLDLGRGSINESARAKERYHVTSFGVRGESTGRHERGMIQKSQNFRTFEFSFIHCSKDWDGIPLRHILT